MVNIILPPLIVSKFASLYYIKKDILLQLKKEKCPVLPGHLDFLI